MLLVLAPLPQAGAIGLTAAATVPGPDFVGGPAEAPGLLAASRTDMDETPTLSPLPATRKGHDCAAGAPYARPVILSGIHGAPPLHRPPRAAA